MATIMTKKRQIQIAAELLAKAYGYVKGDCSQNATAYDFTVSEDYDHIKVFRANGSDDTFYHTETVARICELLGLSMFISLSEIEFGKDKYGNEICRKAIVLHIH